MTPTPQPDPNCPERTLLEEYVLDRLDPGAMLRIDTHLENCARCTEAVRALREEASHLLRALSVSRGESTGPCVSEETLALYLDHALDGDETTRTELHLAECDACRQGLVALHLEISAVMGEGKLPEPSGSRAEFVAGAIKKSTGVPAQSEPTSGIKTTPTQPSFLDQHRSAIGRRAFYLPALAIAITLLGAFLVPVSYTIHIQTALIGAWSFFMWKASHSDVLEAFARSRAATSLRGGTLLLSALLFGASFLSAPMLSAWCLTTSLMSFLAVLFFESKDSAGTTLLERNESVREESTESNALEDENPQKKSDRHAQG